MGEFESGHTEQLEAVQADWEGMVVEATAFPEWNSLPALNVWPLPAREHALSGELTADVERAGPNVCGRLRARSPGPRRGTGQAIATRWARAVHTFVPAVLEAAGMSGDVSDDEVTGPPVDLSFVSHSGPRVPAGVTNEDVLAAIAAVRADVDARVERLEAQVAGIENKVDKITGGRQ